MSDEHTLTAVVTETTTSLTWKLVLFNDDVHSMGEVVAALLRVVGDYSRAADITWEAHSRGQAVVLTGSKEFLEFKELPLARIRLRTAILQ